MISKFHLNLNNSSTSTEQQANYMVPSPHSPVSFPARWSPLISYHFLLTLTLNFEKVNLLAFPRYCFCSMYLGIWHIHPLYQLCHLHKVTSFKNQLTYIPYVCRVFLLVVCVSVCVCTPFGGPFCTHFVHHFLPSWAVNSLIISGT